MIFVGSHRIPKVLTVCFVLGCSNWLLEMLVPTPEGVILYREPELKGTRQWFEPWLWPHVNGLLGLLGHSHRCLHPVSWTDLERFLASNGNRASNPFVEPLRISGSWDVARSLYFTHEPSYTLVPLSRYLGDADVEAAQARPSRSSDLSDLRSIKLGAIGLVGSDDTNSLCRVAKLVHVQEENVRAVSRLHFSRDRRVLRREDAGEGLLYP